ncbi:hypothetical protein BH11PSE12_BH11PSE12_19100 [soil metagenome]
MKKRLLLVSVLLTAISAAQAQSASSQQQFSENSKITNARISERYADDKKLCAEESTSTARMQCLRDAKTEYNSAMAAAKVNQQAAKSNGRQSENCLDCGKVLSVNVQDKQGEAGPLGVIAGGVAGAILGHQVGGGTGRDLATVAGAAGGAYAGHKVEQNMKSGKVWVVTVRFDNGSQNTFNFDNDPGYHAGDLIRKNGSSIGRR